MLVWSRSFEQVVWARRHPPLHATSMLTGVSGPASPISPLTYFQVPSNRTHKAFCALIPKASNPSPDP